jgi:hypothetical protein
VVLDSVEVYDPATDMWTSAAALPVAACDHLATFAGADILVSGGNLGEAGVVIELA